MGGHQSKAHPGQSSNYKKKIEIRDSRVEERELLIRAKTWFEENIYLCPKSNRKVVTMIKQVFKEGGTPNVNDYLELVQ